MKNQSTTNQAAPQTAAVIDVLLPLQVTCPAAGRCRSALYSDVAEGLFTPPVKLGRSSRWPQSEVAALNAARIAGQTNDEIRALVKRLMAARKDALGGSL